MSEIEKLFNRAGLFGIARLSSTGEIIGCDPIAFTIEKQLELIKFIAKSQMGGICFEIDVRGTVTVSARQDWNRYFEYQEWGSSLEEALAKLINSLWGDFSDEEKEQIADILKGKRE